MKKIVSCLLALLLVGLLLALSACKKNENTIVVGASSTPHAEILEQVKAALEEKGYRLEIRIYDDYVLPNTGVENGDLDANYFQHKPYLDWFNAEKGTHIVSVAAIHYEPFGLYGNGITSVSEIAEGATVLIPTDGSNQTRALFLLAAQGLITLREGAKPTDTLTTLDITGNPKNLEIVPVQADLLTAQLKNAKAGSVAVINGNYAIGSGLKIADALATESAAGDAAKTYANIIAVKSGNENSEKIKALVEALQSDAVREYIRTRYNGAVVGLAG